MREQIFEPLRARGWTYARISERLGAGPWFGAEALRRIAAGECLPDDPALEAVLDLVGEVSGVPVTREARDHVRREYLRALEAVRPKLHQEYLWTFVNEQLRADTARVRHQHQVQPTHDEAERPGPHPALELRREVVRHVDEAVRGGVVVPVRLLGPEPPAPVDVTAVLDEIDEALQHMARALRRAVATEEAAMAGADAHSPEPSSAPPTVLPQPDPGDDTLQRAGRAAAYTVTAVLLAAVVLLGYFFLPSLRDKIGGDGAGAAGPTPSTLTDAPDDGDADGGDSDHGSTPDPATPSDKGDTDRDGPDGNQSPGSTTPTPEDEGANGNNRPSPDVTEQPSQLETDEDTGPVLGGAGINASPRLDSADCSQPVVFTFSAAAQRPGTIEYTWLPDDRLLARGVQGRTGTMTFTAPNEQHDEFAVQLTGAQPGERVQGGMNLEVTSPEADRTVIGDAFDITCA
ncbi:hypothetical protein [Streptomyces sp. NPDC057877]|uniref:hypothetical protein n=1 Tax=Streptomyces sp. NPDC057877 TaxID=3346269 RepID=UPI0036740BFF